jgi:hypothetical protein
MSTYQPPNGQPPEGTPAYAQPQDPWAGGFDQGVASVPTDPIPQQYDPYAQGGVPPGVWAQETAPHPGQPYGYVPATQKSKAGLIVVVFLIVLVLGGGGGFAAWYVTTHRPTTGASPNASASSGPQTSSVPTTPAAVAFDPHVVKIGDCLVNNGTEADPELALANCATAKSFKVIKVSSGATIPEGPGDKFDRDTTSVAECQGTGFQSWYGYQDAFSDDKDLFFCLKNN